MKDFLILFKSFSLSLFVFIVSCSEEQKNSFEEIKWNKLDSVFSDKILYEKTEVIRKNNFEKLLNINVSDLLTVSKLYNTSRIDENYFLLEQNKYYEKARLFNAILKIDSNKVIDYYIINDFEIKDVIVQDENILLISDDFENHNTYWENSKELKIIQLNEKLKENWNYRISYTNPLEAVSIKVYDTHNSYIINVITGCHMCYNTVELILNKNGKLVSVKEIDLYNATSITNEKLNNIFIQKKK